MLYNKEEDKLFCLVDAPDKESVRKHHEKFGTTCEWITEVETTSLSNSSLILFYLISQ